MEVLSQILREYPSRQNKVFLAQDDGCARNFTQGGPITRSFIFRRQIALGAFEGPAVVIIFAAGNVEDV